LGRPFKLGVEGELALLRRLHMLEREELGKASRCFSLDGTLLACGDLEPGETRVRRRWRCEERWQGRLKAVSIVCRLGIDIPGTPRPKAGDGEGSSMNRDSSFKEGCSESSLLFLPPGCKLILLSPCCSPGCSSSIGKVSKLSLNSSSILTLDPEWSTWSTNRSKITSAAISAMMLMVGWWRPVYN